MTSYTYPLFPVCKIISTSENIFSDTMLINDCGRRKHRKNFTMSTAFICLILMVTAELFHTLTSLCHLGLAFGFRILKCAVHLGLHEQGRVGGCTTLQYIWAHHLVHADHSEHSRITQLTPRASASGNHHVDPCTYLGSPVLRFSMFDSRPAIHPPINGNIFWGTEAVKAIPPLSKM